MDELMSKLSDLLLSSGFGNPRDTGDDSDRTMQALHDAILEALFNGGVLPDDLLEKLFGDQAEGNEQQMRDQLEAADPEHHRADEGVGLHHDAARPRAEKARRAQGGGRRRRARRGEVRGHRQGARFPRLPRAARSARLVRPQQRRPARHARPVDRRRDQRRAEAVRVRRHDEHRRHRDDPQRRAARVGGTRTATPGQAKACEGAQLATVISTASTSTIQT